MEGAAKYEQEVEDYDTTLLRESRGSGAIAMDITTFSEMTEWTLISRSALPTSLVLIGHLVETTISACVR